MGSSGLLVTFEGTEGAGKSTLISAVAEQLNVQGKSTLVTREPGGSAVAEQIRRLILENPMDPWTELFLYEAARAEHLAKTVLPGLRDGRIVLCDRFTDSSLAYQSEARGLPWEAVAALNEWATRGIRPSLTVLLDIDPALGLKNAKDPNRFEAEGVAFQTLVRRGFLKAMRQEPKRWLKIKARSGTPAQMAEPIVEEILRRQSRRTAPKKAPTQTRRRKNGRR